MMECVHCELDLQTQEGKMKDYSKANVEVPSTVHELASVYPSKTEYSHITPMLYMYCRVFSGIIEALFHLSFTLYLSSVFYIYIYGI